MRSPRLASVPFRAAAFTLLTAVAVLLLTSLSWGFSDVTSSDPYAAAIADLAARGVIGGFPDGTFGPEKSVTRQQFAKMIVLTLGLTPTEADVCPFPDVEVSGPGSLYPDNFVAVAFEKGITTGKNGGYLPGEHISRAQVVTMVVRAAENLLPGTLSDPPAGFAATWAEFDPIHGPRAAKAEANGLLEGLPLASLDPWGAMPRGEVAQVLENLLHTSEGTTPTAPAGQELLHFRRSYTGTWDVESVSGKTGGRRVSGNLAAWVEEIEGSYFGRVAAVDPEGEILLFQETAAGWDVVDLSAASGFRAAGPIALHERVSDDEETIFRHLVTTDGAGHLLHFSREGGGDWQAEDVTAEIGVTVVGRPGVFDGPDESLGLAVMTPAGEVLFLFDSSDYGWQEQNLTALTGLRAEAPPTAWINLTGRMTGADRYVAFRDTGGRLAILQAPFLPGEWRQTVLPVEVDGPLDGWIGFYGRKIFTNQLAAVRNGRLAFAYAHRDDSEEWLPWQWDSVSELTGIDTEGPLLGATLRDPLRFAVDYVFAPSTGGDLIAFSSTGLGTWRGENASELTGRRVQGQVGLWVGPDAQQTLGVPMIHLAAAAAD